MRPKGTPDPITTNPVRALQINILGRLSQTLPVDIFVEVVRAVLDGQMVGCSIYFYD